MKKDAADRRKFSGNRVIAKCDIVLKSLDPFSSFENNRSGYMILNIRGGSFYFIQIDGKDSVESIFPDGDSSEFQQLKLYSEDGKSIVINDIKIMFLRKRETLNRPGVVFRFVDISDQHLDNLMTLCETLPLAGDDEALAILAQDPFLKRL